MPIRKSSFTMKITKRAIMILSFISICIILRSCIIEYNLKAYYLKLELEEEKSFRDIEEDTEYLINKLNKISRNKYKTKFIKGVITAINEQQHVGHVRKLNSTSLLKAIERLQNITFLKLETVIVIQVHGNYRYLRVFLESLRRVVGISECLLIFVHDYYDTQVYNAIGEVHFARVMQMFYPYSIQLHPYRYPGEDLKFCEKLFQCVSSNERDPIQAQTKLFWWWIINQVFDHVEVLKNYDSYIYFLEVEQYLTNDILIMATKLEQMQPRYCPECRILSLAARPPRAEHYRRENSSLIVSVWGWSKSKYINSGIGFNRTTWNEIKRLKEEFCYFDDSTWENSLKYLASKTHQKQFYMLSTEGSRIFPTNDCTLLGNGTGCDVASTYKDIVKFIRTTAGGLFPYTFKLGFDGMDGVNKMDKIEETGGWDDARDREMCMFIASNGRRVYY